MVEISEDFEKAIMKMIEERFSPDLLWAATGHNYKDDHCNKFAMKLRVKCP